MTPVPLSGIQHTIEHGDYAATIASVGASLRSLTHRGRDLVVPFDADEVRPAYRGATLAPWPNRVVDGRWSLDGREQQLPLTEPSRGHALHGLASWLAFETADASADAVTLTATIEPQSGYPFRVRVDVTYRLGDDGLTQTVSASNEGAGRAPFGTGPHPYLVAGPSPLDEWTLALPASEVLAVTPDRLIPTALASVETEAGGIFDFRRERAIGRTEIDHAFTGLARDASGVATVTVTDPAGGGVAMRWDAGCPWVQIHTADLPDPASNRLGLAVEPMTCPPDAFNSGTDLVWLETGSLFRVAWTIAAI